MEKSSELLIRSTLHDLANVLAGVRGILDLNLPDQPFSQRDRERLEAVLEEGVTTLNRCRQLAVTGLPDGLPEPGPVWRELLQEALQPMGTLFRCRFELSSEGTPEWDQWPGELLRGYVQAMTRQVLPYARTATLAIHFSADPEGWRVRWSPAPRLPESLAADPERMAMDICSRWAQQAGASLEAGLSCGDGALLARIPRKS